MDTQIMDVLQALILKVSNKTIVYYVKAVRSNKDFYLL